MLPAAFSKSFLLLKMPEVGDTWEKPCPGPAVPPACSWVLGDTLPAKLRVGPHPVSSWILQSSLGLNLSIDLLTPWSGTDFYSNKHRRNKCRLVLEWLALREINMPDETSKLKMTAAIINSNNSPSTSGHSSHTLLKYFLEVSIITVKNSKSKAECEKEKKPLDLERSSHSFLPPSCFVSCWWMNHLNDVFTGSPGSIHFPGSMLLFPKLLHLTSPGGTGKLISGAHGQHRSIQDSGKLIVGRETTACGFLTRSWDHQFSVMLLLLETQDVSGVPTYSLGDSSV